MKTRLLFSVLCLLGFFFTNAQSYTIDAGHSSVQIEVERFGMVDVVGRFKDVSGSITFNAEAPAETSAQATIQVNSYDANNIGGEEAVKSPAFLDAANFPEIKFTSTGCENKEGVWYLLGDLTIHGETNSIALPFTIKGPQMDLPTQKQAIAFNASTVINRQDYGVSFDRKLPNGTSLIGNDVKITLRVLAIAE